MPAGEPPALHGAAETSNLQAPASPGEIDSPTKTENGFSPLHKGAGSGRLRSSRRDASAPATSIHAGLDLRRPNTQQGGGRSFRRYFAAFVVCGGSDSYVAFVMDHFEGVAIEMERVPEAVRVRSVSSGVCG
jgi:hypothetical protein